MPVAGAFCRCLFLLRLGERPYQCEATVLFVLKQVLALQRSAFGAIVRIVGLGPHEGGRQHHLPADHQAVERKVVAGKLPAPRLARRGRAEQGEVVAPLAQHFRVHRQLTKKMVEAHHVARLLVTGARQAGAHHIEDGLAQGQRHLFKAQAVFPHIHFGVVPAPPFARVEWQQQGFALLRRHHRNQPRSRRHHRRRRCAVVTPLVQTGLRHAVSGDALERLTVEDFPGIEQQLTRNRVGVTRHAVLVGIAPVHRLDARGVQRRDAGSEVQRLFHPSELIRFCCPNYPVSWLLLLPARRVSSPLTAFNGLIPNSVITCLTKPGLAEK